MYKKVLSVTDEQPPLVTAGCESSSGFPAIPKDICHTLGTTATPNSTPTTVPSSVAISKSERETPQVPHSEKGTRIPLRRDSKTLLFQELKVHNVFSSIAPMKESTTEQHEGETGTGGGEATSTQIARATSIYIILYFLQIHHIVFTQDLCQ